MLREVRNHFVASAAVATALRVLASCAGPADLVASSPGDFDPVHPPQVLSLTGSIQLSDPAVTQVAERLWLYSTGPGIAVRSSADILAWQDEKPVFDQNPAWIADVLPAVTDLWSPSIAYFGGQFHLYYAASTYASDQSCIGHATADSIGPGEAFTDLGSLICSNVSGATDNFNAIDPSIFFEDETDPWLVFGSYDSGIKLIALDAQGNRLDSQMTSIAARSSDNPAIQAPFLMKRSGYYYLFVSFDHCCEGANSDHSIRVGRATELTGPYVDRDGVEMLNGGGTLVLASDSNWRGPGSNTVFMFSGKRYEAYHAYDASNGTATLRIAELDFDNDGWPVSGGP